MNCHYSNESHSNMERAFLFDETVGKVSILCRFWTCFVCLYVIKMYTNKTPWTFPMATSLSRVVCKPFIVSVFSFNFYVNDVWKCGPILCIRDIRSVASTSFIAHCTLQSNQRITSKLWRAWGRVRITSHSLNAKWIAMCVCVSRGDADDKSRY